MAADTTETTSFGKRLLWPGVLSLCALIVLLSLGTWQVQRMHWKQDLIANVAARLSSEPASLPMVAEWDRLEPERYQYQRVSLSGHYLHAYQQQAYMVVSDPQGGPFGGQGHWIMTPFELSGGGVVWINRGFVPLHLKDVDITTGHTEKTTLSGLMRAPEIAGFATPGNKVGFDGNIWFVRNPAEMTRQSSLENTPVAPFFVDLEAGASSALPQSGETRIAFANRHFGYVITWYGIALTLIGVFTAFAVKEYRRK